MQLGENKWFNKRLEVCNHLNFTSFVLFMISVHNFLTVPSAPPSLSIPLPSLSANYRTKQNYFDLYARRESSPTLPTLIPPWRSISHRCCCPPARAVFFFIFFVFICFFQLSIDSGIGAGAGDGNVRPTKCFDSAWTRLQLLSTKRVDERRI